MSEQLLYNIPQVQAQLGGLSRSFVYQEIGLGRLRTVKIGARTFVSRAALEDYIACVAEKHPVAS